MMHGRTSSWTGGTPPTLLPCDSSLELLARGRELPAAAIGIAFIPGEVFRGTLGRPDQDRRGTVRPRVEDFDRYARELP
jgi:hypothetical protein